MKLKYSLLLLAVFAGVAASGQERLRREDSFLGIHFDFHAGSGDRNIGARTTPEMVQSILDMVRPDYIQIDCKGHGGYCSYPTEVGNPAPDIAGDPLVTWRDVTAKNGVALYLHYSGVWDSRAIQLHPGWAAIGADGNRSTTATSLFGPYVDSLLIPQFKELAGKYKIDGVWVDGECWATSVDYSPKAVRMFREETGWDAPKSPGEPHWYEWKQFNREAFRRYLRHYIAAVRSEYPDFQICSNWAFTHHMSEPVSAPVDFLSGDYSASNSVNSARVAARYLAFQGVPWDLMAWSFGYDSGKSLGQKPAVQLKREAAVTLAQGGGFQAYITQERDGSVNLEKLKPMAEVAVFARERQPYCHHSVSVPQVAVLLSTFDYQHYDAPSALFPNYVGRASGILQCLLESQNSVDLVGENTLLPDMGRYPLIVVPECDTLAASFRDDLLDYAAAGGSLLVIGSRMASYFSEASGLGLDGKEWSVSEYGKGKVGFVPEGISGAYESGQDADGIRSRLKDMVDRLFPDPVVKCESSPFVDVSVRKQNGTLQVHLVNTSGDHRRSPFVEAIEPVRDLRISVSCPSKPSGIVLRPSGRKVKFSWKDGRAHFKLDSLEIYDIIEIRQDN